MRRIALLVAGAIAAGIVPLSSLAGQTAAVPATELDAIRRATGKYQDVQAALADGYILAEPMCVESVSEGQPPQLGGMGLHYVRPDLLGITGMTPRVHGTGTHTDFMQPSVLVYEPMTDGHHRLVAIENLVWAAAWADAGHTAPPSFHGYQYYYMHDNPETPADEAHGFEPHWELHMWLYRDNPSGMFMQFNPRVTCAGWRMAAGS